MLRKVLCVSFLLLLAELVCAKSLISPYWPALSSDQQNFVLNTAKADQAELVVMYNKSADTIWLNRDMPDNPGVSAGWSSQLDSGHWSALSWMGGFSLSCQKLSQQMLVQVPCAQVIQLYRPVGQKKIAQGSYWVVENKTKAALINALVKAMIL